MSYNYTPGRGSEIVRKLRVYVNGMLWLRARLPLEPENANLLQSGVSKLVYSDSVLHSGVNGILRCEVFM
jgi:hypothetical protein